LCSGDTEIGVTFFLVVCMSSNLVYEKDLRGVLSIGRGSKFSYNVQVCSSTDGRKWCEGRVWCGLVEHAGRAATSKNARACRPWVQLTTYTSVHPELPTDARVQRTQRGRVDGGRLGMVGEGFQPGRGNELAMVPDHGSQARAQPWR